MITGGPDILTAISDREAVELRRLALGKRVLEIGSQYGASTVLMAQVAEEVVAVDHHLGDPQAGYTDSLETFRDNIRFHALRNVVPIVADWRVAFSLLRLSYFDLVFYDAAHDEQTVYEFLEAAVYGHIPFALTIALHDYGRFGVKPAVDAWQGKYHWDLTVIDTLAVLTQ